MRSGLRQSGTKDRPMGHRKGFWAGSPGEVPDRGAGCQRDGPVSLLSTISVATVFSDSRQSV